MSDNLKHLGNENSYTDEFINALCKKLKLTTHRQRYILKHTITLATQAYFTNYEDHVREPAPHEIKKELKKALSNIDKAVNSLAQIYTSSEYSEAVINNLYDVIDKQYPSLHNLLDQIIRVYPEGTITSPLHSLDLLSAMSDGIEQTLDNFEPVKTPNKSEALYHWIMILSAQLEPMLGRKLEQSRYHKTDKGGEYVSKKETNDSELLLHIIQPLDPNVTISQIETALKETRKERHEAPWTDYFPW